MWKRFGTSYRGAGELSWGDPLSLSDLRRPDAIFFAADTNGRWRGKPLSWRRACQEASLSRIAPQDGWLLNAAFFDGRVRRVSFPDALWGPYLDFLRSRR
jgi:hypothetical protein